MEVVGTELLTLTTRGYIRLECHHGCGVIPSHGFPAHKAVVVPYYLAKGQVPELVWEEAHDYRVTVEVRKL